MAGLDRIRTVRAVAWLTLVCLAGTAWASGAWGYWLQNKFAGAQPGVHGAWYWRQACLGVQCQLCPRYCFLPEGLKGWCRVRVNAGGSLYSQVFGRAAAVHVDPVEKKPVFHLLPGSTALSLATAGCNLRCDFCQNWSLSQAEPETLPAELLMPGDLVAAAQHSRSRSIAYTYSEPVVFYEYMAETARLARQAGLYNIMISGGYINPEPLRRLLPELDVVKIDLKGFNEKYYARIVGGRLEPVLAAVRTVAAAGKPLEIVNLIVPGQNNASEQVLGLSRWIHTAVGDEVPVFFSRFLPGYRMTEAPMTSITELHAARDMALGQGLHFVYTGNVAGDEGENTYCPQCGLLLVQRVGYTLLANRIAHGRCPQCKRLIPGIWTDERKPQPDQGRSSS